MTLSASGVNVGCRHLREVVLQRRALVGEDQPRLVEAVATEHAADRVGDEVVDSVVGVERLQSTVSSPGSRTAMRFACNVDCDQRHSRGSIVASDAELGDRIVASRVPTLAGQLRSPATSPAADRLAQRCRSTSPAKPTSLEPRDVSRRLQCYLSRVASNLHRRSSALEQSTSMQGALQSSSDLEVSSVGAGAVEAVAVATASCRWPDVDASSIAPKRSNRRTRDVENRSPAGAERPVEASPNPTCRPAEYVGSMSCELGSDCRSRSLRASSRPSTPSPRRSLVPVPRRELAALVVREPPSRWTRLRPGSAPDRYRR